MELLDGTPVRLIGVYAPSGGELDLARWLALADPAAAFAWPRVTGPRAMTWHVASPSDLVRGYRGLSEPPADTATVDPLRLDLLLVPGLGFDRFCGRLGRGGAFFDALLAAPSRPPAVGVAYAEQVVPRVPVAAHDRPVDVVVTDVAVAARGRWSRSVHDARLVVAERGLC